MTLLLKKITSAAQVEEQTQLYKKKTANALIPLATIYKAIVIDNHEGLGFDSFKDYQEAKLPEENYNNLLDQAKCSYLVIKHLGRDYLTICSRAFFRPLAKLKEDEINQVISFIKKKFKAVKLKREHLTAENACHAMKELFPPENEETHDEGVTTDAEPSTWARKKELPSTEPSIQPSNRKIEKKMKRMAEIRNELDTYDGSIGLSLHLSRAMKNILLAQETANLIRLFNLIHMCWMG